MTVDRILDNGEKLSLLLDAIPVDVPFPSATWSVDSSSPARGEPLCSRSTTPAGSSRVASQADTSPPTSSATDSS
ncbi:hypothetical protein ACIPYS_09735 [Kitasatospora sp. NPDC089913]|uniref:hypothetical protein n=1 Tax=Streptomycetaceae TaxID=2062 RepID=UPI000879EC36|nr:hypothetical protein [Streptomyces sp. TLI_053]SDS59859.1 hypothetical protein SAMN05216371_0236 [Streptomyces sp. TLI_053]